MTSYESSETFQTKANVNLYSFTPQLQKIR